MRQRRLSAAIFVLITLFFAIGIKNVQIKTVFSDLLPKDDPFVQVYKDHPNFGNPTGNISSPATGAVITATATAQQGSSAARTVYAMVKVNF